MGVRSSTRLRILSARSARLRSAKPNRTAKNSSWRMSPISKIRGAPALQTPASGLLTKAPTMLSGIMCRMKSTGRICRAASAISTKACCVGCGMPLRTTPLPLSPALVSKQVRVLMRLRPGELARKVSRQILRHLGLSLSLLLTLTYRALKTNICLNQLSVCWKFLIYQIKIKLSVTEQDE
jgi:hypothetical protein